MSERAASKCGGKKRHSSERRARDAAKASGRKFGIRMNEYSCEFCKGWHVGSTYSRDGRAARIDAAEMESIWQG